MDSAQDQELSFKAIGRLFLVGAVGTVLALVLALVAAGTASEFPGRGIGFVTGPAAAALFFLAIVRLLRATEPAAAREARRARLSEWENPGLLDAVLTELRGAPATAKSPGAVVLLLSLVAFVASGSGFRSASSLVLLVVVLLVHELGHLAAMRAFGYRDLKVFFIPFIGAATAGRKDRAPAWQQVIVSLMGPAPGLLAAFCFAAIGRNWVGQPLVQQAIGLTIFLNAVNLLPFEPFDGGRIASILLFATHPRARVVFGALTAAVLGVLALRFGAIPLAAASGLVVARMGARYRIAACAARIRATAASVGATLPITIGDAPDELIRKVFRDWRSGSQRAGKPAENPRAVATAIRAIYDAALVPSAGWAARVVLAVVYAALLVPALFVVANLWS